jgi:endonuclease VIII
VEGPSIHLAAEQLRPFIGRRVRRVRGNSRIGIQRFRRARLTDVFAWGKHLVMQFETFALRIHFLLWGSFAATIRNRSVTGDYRRTSAPRLVLEFDNGHVIIWSASLRFLDTHDASQEYDFAADVLSDQWDPGAALRKARAFRRAEIADVLLDQAIFAGVGNIIKNEILFRTRTSPFTKVWRLPDRRLKDLVSEARAFSFQFLEWRRVFALRKHLEIYGRSVCPACGGPVTRAIHGMRGRRSFFCVRCQRVRRARPGATGSVRRRTAASSPRTRPRARRRRRADDTRRRTKIY